MDRRDVLFRSSSWLRIPTKAPFCKDNVARGFRDNGALSYEAFCFERVLDAIVALRRSLGSASAPMRSQSAPPHIRSAPEGARTHFPHSQGAGKAIANRTHLYDSVKALGGAGPRSSLSVATDHRGRRAETRALYQHATVAPSGTTPCVRKRQKAIISLRAIATIMVLRTRPLWAPTRSWNHCESALSG